jgi:AcrR family transcriptional regulator
MTDVVRQSNQNKATASGDDPDPAGPRRRGRRPSGEDTRATLLAAALDVFAEQGYAGATVRAIATRAGVDPAMVNHWFGGKRGLFLAAIQAPFDPAELVTQAFSDDPDTVAERIVRGFVTAWDTHHTRFKALVQSVISQETAGAAMQEFIIDTVIRQVTTAIGADQAEWRISLCASQLIGLGLTRYVLRLEPMASADVETVVATVAPTLQRYLTGPITPA